jgi:hypothetical protein
MAPSVDPIHLVAAMMILVMLIAGSFLAGFTLGRHGK